MLQLSGSETTLWLSGELPQNVMAHGNSLQYGGGQMFGGNSMQDPTAGYPNAQYVNTYTQGSSGQLSNNASTERLSGQLPIPRHTLSI